MVYIPPPTFGYLSNKILGVTREKRLSSAGRQVHEVLNAAYGKHLPVSYGSLMRTVALEYGASIAVGRCGSLCRVDGVAEGRCTSVVAQAF